jgi:hypothetical protein
MSLEAEVTIGYPDQVEGTPSPEGTGPIALFPAVALMRLWQVQAMIGLICVMVLWIPCNVARESTMFRPTPVI